MSRHEFVCYTSPMKKIKPLAYIVGGLLLVGLLAGSAFSFFQPKAAGLYIDATPQGNVLLNGKEVGETPYRMTGTPGEMIIKIVPKEISQTILIPYETRVALFPGVETVVRHTFGATPETGSGEIISFEQIAKKETSLAIVAIPDSAQITIDGKEKAFAPYKTSSITSGDHTLLVTAKGYADRTVKVKTHEGYKLTAVITLSKTGNATLLPTATPAPLSNMVLILPIAAGTLRVHESASIESAEVGVVEPGKSYPYVSTDEKEEWFKIVYAGGKEGWVASQYAKRQQNSTSFPTTLPTKKPVSVTPTTSAIIGPAL